MRVLCCTMYSSSRQPLADISLPNLFQYAKIHGYDMAVIEIEDDKWEFRKHEAFKQYFEDGFDLIFYKDIDSLITNLSVPVLQFVDSEHHYFLTKDFNELNNGVCIILNTPEGRLTNDRILNGRGQFQNEQNVINSYIKDLEFSRYIRVLSHPSINSYDYSLYPECKEYVGREDLGDWVSGKSFILHVPGLSLEKRVDILKQAKITE